MKKLAFLIGLLSLSAAAQNTVILAPLPIFSSYLQNGKPNSLGCLFTYASGTTTPIASYTDSSGVTTNPNPVILSAGGTANVWISVGTAYSFKIRTYGGINCAIGSTIATINGIGGGASILTTAVPFSSTPSFIDQSQNQLFTITLTGSASAEPLAAVGIIPPGYITFQITQDSVGGHTFGWPSNVIGGAPVGLNANQVTTQEFVWNGTNATALGAAVIGSGPNLSAGSISLNGSSPSGTGGICLVSNCALLTPLINSTAVVNSPGTYVPAANSSSPGTVVNTLTKLSVVGTSALASIASAGDTGGVVGICVLNCGTGATNSTLQQNGAVVCVFDGSTTAGDYVQISGTVAGNCHDAGAAYPIAGGQIIGRVGSTNAGAGNYTINLFGPELQPANNLVYTASGSLVPHAHTVITSVTLSGGGSGFITITGGATFTSNQSCVGTDSAAVQPVLVKNFSLNAVTVNGTAGDTVTVICVGN